jgi:nitroimidazol reductase NimA-like FMN-containing flavoprotein (pyridoxamine 5'-phosphate oxidase superfamily)
MRKYHMNKAEREINDPDTLVEILKRGKYAIIGMCRDKEPYVVTLSYGYDTDHDCLYFHSASKGLKLDFITENPEVCATVLEDNGYVKNDCSHRYRSIVLRGKMYVVSEEAEKLQGMDVLAYHLEDDPDARQKKLRNLASADWSRLTVLRLDIEELRGKTGQ